MFIYYDTISIFLSIYIDIHVWVRTNGASGARPQRPICPSRGHPGTILLFLPFLSLSLSLAHTHTHTLSLSLTLSLVLALSLSRNDSFLAHVSTTLCGPSSSAPFAPAIDTGGHSVRARNLLEFPEISSERVSMINTRAQRKLPHARII